MIPLTPVLDHILSKRVSGQQQQQQQWQQIELKNIKSKPSNTNKFTGLLDKHFESSPLANNPYFPLSFIMPTKHLKPIPAATPTPNKSSLVVASPSKPKHKKQSSIKLFLSEPKEGRSNHRRRGGGREGNRLGRSNLGRGGGGDGPVQQSLYSKIINDKNKTQTSAPSFTLSSTSMDSIPSKEISTLDSKAYRIPVNTDTDTTMARAPTNKSNQEVSISDSGSDSVDSDGWENSSDATPDWLKEDDRGDRWEDKEWDDEDEQNWEQQGWELEAAKEAELDQLITTAMLKASNEVYSKKSTVDGDWIDQAMHVIDERDGDEADYVEDPSFDPMIEEGKEHDGLVISNTSELLDGIVTRDKAATQVPTVTGITASVTTTKNHVNLTGIAMDTNASQKDSTSSNVTATVGPSGIMNDGSEYSPSARTVNQEKETDTIMNEAQDDVLDEKPGTNVVDSNAPPSDTTLTTPSNTSKGSSVIVNDGTTYSPNAGTANQGKETDIIMNEAQTEALGEKSGTNVVDSTNAPPQNSDLPGSGTQIISTGTDIPANTSVVDKSPVPVNSTVPVNTEGALTTTVPIDSTNMVAVTVPVNTDTVLPSDPEPFATVFDTNWLFEYHPKEHIDQFKIDFLLGGLITAVRRVDPKAYIKSWDDTSTSKLWSKETIPKIAKEVASFVEDPHTTSAGAHGKLYGRIRMVTNMTLYDIKLNNAFGIWIRAYGLFLDISEIPSTRPTLVGFFDHILPHTTRIDMFQNFLHSVVKISRPFQIYNQLIYASGGSDEKCYAYVLKSDYKDSATILQDMKNLSASSKIGFTVWSEFKDHTDPADKLKMVQEMTIYNRGHASLVFSGVLANDYMRLKNNKRSKDAATDGTISESQQASIDLDTQRDLSFSKLRCLEFMQQYFVDSDQNPIFTRIDGPLHNKIQVTFAKPHFSKVQAIKKQYLNVLSLRMTSLSREKCIAPAPTASDTDITVWTPPKAVTQSNYTNPYSNNRNGKISFAFVSYKDAAASGTRQIDIPLSPPNDQLQQPIPSILTPAALSTATAATTSTVTTNSIDLTAITEAQTKFQVEYDAKIARLDASLSEWKTSLFLPSNRLLLSPRTFKLNTQRFRKPFKSHKHPRRHVLLRR